MTFWQWVDGNGVGALVALVIVAITLGYCVEAVCSHFGKK